MRPREICRGIYQVGAVDWDRRLFDELIPLPEGTSYNAYIVKGSEKTALIDTVDPTKERVLLENLDRLGLERIDYVIANHAEQDHSGSIPAVLEKYPMAKVVTNNKCMSMLVDHLHVPEERFIAVEDGTVLSLGDRSLEFILAPWVHWPETMFTYSKEDKLLFTCDFLGSHLATSKMFVDDWADVSRGAKRYYAEIMMPFRHIIPKHLEKIRSMDVDIIAPSHGPLYNNIEDVLNAYEKWVSGEPKNEVVVAYVSMHDSTRRMVEGLVEDLGALGVGVKVFDLPKSDVGELAMALVDAATIVLATPTVLAGAHPSAIYAAHLAAALRPKARFATIMGSYGWGGKTVEQISGILGGLKVEVIEPVIVKGYPREEDMKRVTELAESILDKHKSIGIVEEM